MKEKKKKVKLIIALAVALVVMIGGTYAWLTLTKQGTKVNVIKAGTFELTLDDEASEGILITGEAAQPIPTSEGVTLEGYNFTVKNTGDLKADYTLYLDDIEAVSDEEITNRMADKYVRYSLNYTENNETALLTTIGSNPNRILYQGTLESGASKTFNLKLWIDQDADNNVLGTTFAGQIRLEAEQARKATEFTVGDYVQMTPMSTSYTTDTAMTGYTSTQTINPSELNLWRVIKINDDNTVDMVSEYVSSTRIIFSGQTGYQNYVGYLNTIAKQYENRKYTSGSRHMGYDGTQTEYITDTTALTATTAPQTEDTSSSNVTVETEGKGLGDVGYETDYNLVNTALGTRVAYKVGTTTATGYWLASRWYIYEASVHWYFNGRLISTSGDLDYYSYSLYKHNWDSFYEGSYIGAVRPIVTLKSGVKASSGDGSSSSPYVLN